MNEVLINVIVLLVKKYKSTTDEDQKAGLDYLLGQTIRQYQVPDKHIHMSKAAYDLWNRLTSSDEKEHTYKDKVTIDKLADGASITMEKYVGASSNGEKREYVNGETFVYRDIFHDDHVVPVSFIKQLLFNLSDPNPSNVQAELDNMHICKLLKCEDRSIGRTRGRHYSYEDTIADIYKSIELEY